MKKNIISRIVAMIMAFVAVATANYVVAPSVSFADPPRHIQVCVNSKAVTFPDAQPFVDANSRTLIPVRFVAEALGAKVDFDSSTRTVLIEKDGVNIKMPIGSKTFTVTKNGADSTVTMDTEAIIKEDRTYVPIRFVAEQLGCYVDWSSYYDIVDIVLPEDSFLKAEDIKRLRSYSLDQALSDAQVKMFDNEAFSSFKGQYAFANAHYYLLTRGNTTIQYEDRESFSHSSPKGIVVAPVGTNSYDFMNFAVTCMKNLVENPHNNEFGSWSCHDKWGNADFVFHTDSSLVYHQAGPDYNNVTIRGVMELVNSQAPSDLVCLEKKMGQPVEYGKSYTVDVEFVLNYRNGFLVAVRGGRFDADGNRAFAFYSDQESWVK